MEFENLQIEIPVSDEKDDYSVTENFRNQVATKKYYNQSQGFVVGLDLNSKDAAVRKANRAKRFGLKIEDNGKKEDRNPFETIDLKRIVWPPVTDAAFAEKRPEALHFYGVNDMSTKDVFDYFKDYGPDTMEWIDDCTCNVVWDSEYGALSALKAMSRAYKELVDCNSNDSQNSDIDDIEISEMEAKEIWRIALPHKEGDSLFLRFATLEDKKLPGAAKRSMYYLIHGRGGTKRGKGKGLISSSRKRKMKQADEFIRENVMSKAPDVTFHEIDVKQGESDVEKMDVDEDLEPSTKRMQLEQGKDTKRKTRMRMYADDVEKMPNDKGVFDRLGVDEHLRIEVTSDRTNRWTSGRKNQHRRGLSSSEEDDDEEESLEVTDSFPRETSEDLIIHVDKSANDEMKEDLITYGTKTNKGAAVLTNVSSKANEVSDLREKLHRKQKHLGLTEDQLNLCIEVTEVSDED